LEHKRESKDLLDLLIEAQDESTGSVLSDKEISDQVLTFLLAGHETTSVAMSWVLYCLGQHPDVAKKVTEEVTSVLANEELTWEALDKFKYLGNVIKETMRLFPPAPITNRKPIKDDIICGQPIPAGTAIIICPGVQHRLPQYWENPEKFDPDRWDKNTEPVNNFTYMPFLAGPRGCIGNKFAIAEMKTVLATLLNQFTFSNAKGYQVKKKLTVTMRPSPGLLMEVNSL